MWADLWSGSESPSWVTSPMMRCPLLTVAGPGLWLRECGNILCLPPVLPCLLPRMLCFDQLISFTISPNIFIRNLDSKNHKLMNCFLLTFSCHLLLLNWQFCYWSVEVVLFVDLDWLANILRCKLGGSALGWVRRKEPIASAESRSSGLPAPAHCLGPPLRSVQSRLSDS